MTLDPVPHWAGFNYPKLMMHSQQWSNLHHAAAAFHLTGDSQPLRAAITAWLTYNGFSAEEALQKAEALTSKDLKELALDICRDDPLPDVMDPAWTVEQRRYFCRAIVDILADAVIN